MQDWFKERMEINRQIRRILVRNRIDLGRLSVTVTQKRTAIRGQLATLSGSDIKLSSPLLQEMTSSLKRIKGVKNLSLQFDNWYQDGEGGAWKKAGRSLEKNDETKTDSPSYSSGSGPGGKSYTIRTRNDFQFPASDDDSDESK